MPEFYLSVLDASFTSIKATLEQKKLNIPDVSGSVEVEISQANIRKLFQYDSSNVIAHINDISADDLRYYVDGTKWPESNAGAVISDLSMVGNVVLNLKGDYISHLAKQLFNTERGVDLFNNEDNLLTDFKSKCHTFWDDLSKNYIYKIDKTVGSLYNGTDGKGKYLTNSTDTNVNLTRELLLQTIFDASGRFQDISGIVDGSLLGIDNDTNLFPIPFIGGDKVSFILTVKSDPDQKTVVASTGPIINRPYKISLKVVAPPSAPTITNVTTANSKTTVTFTHSVNGLTTYKVKDGNNELGTGSASPIEISNLGPNTYSIRVEATNVAGSVLSDQANHTIPQG